MKIKSDLIEAHIFREVEDGIEFLLLKRSEKQSYPGLWQMVTGKIEANENAHQTALREIKEETGFKPAQLWVAPTISSFYEPKDEYICLLPVFAARMDGKTNVILSEEHTEFKWVYKDEAIKLLAWPGQRKSVDIIEDYFLNEKSFFHFVEISVA